jgi:hypothetical protein
MKDLTEFFLCPACNSNLESVIAVDFISDNYRRTMVTSSNSNNNIITAKQKWEKVRVEILDRMNKKRGRNK